MLTISLVALQPLVYAGRDVSAGQQFEAQPIDAAALTYQRQARYGSRTILTRDMPPVPDESQDVASPSDQPKRRRTYKRRDLVPEV